MIGSITGKLTAKGDRFVLLETGGLGYRVYVPAMTLGKLQQDKEYRLFTHHHVSENADELYGFQTLEEVTFFEALLSISSVGPKTALNVLGIATLDELHTAVQTNDPTLLTKVSGIGRKTAERIVLELQDKIDMTPTSGSGVVSEDGEVVDALIALGYTRKEARDAVRRVPATVQGVSERVREALKYTGGHGRS